MYLFLSQGTKNMVYMKSNNYVTFVKAGVYIRFGTCMTELQGLILKKNKMIYSYIYSANVSGYVFSKLATDTARLSYIYLSTLTLHQHKNKKKRE